MEEAGRGGRASDFPGFAVGGEPLEIAAAGADVEPAAGGERGSPKARHAIP